MDQDGGADEVDAGLNGRGDFLDEVEGSEGAVGGEETADAAQEDHNCTRIFLASVEHNHPHHAQDEQDDEGDAEEVEHGLGALLELLTATSLPLSDDADGEVASARHCSHHQANLEVVDVGSEAAVEDALGEDEEDSEHLVEGLLAADLLRAKERHEAHHSDGTSHHKRRE